MENYDPSKCCLYFLSIIRRSTMWSRVWMALWSEPTEPIKMWVTVKLTWCDEYKRIESGRIGVITVLFHLCRYLLAFPWTSRQAVCQRDRAAGRSAGRSFHNPEWCKFQCSDALSLYVLKTFSVSVTATLMRMLCKHSSSNTSQSRPTKLFFTVYWLCDNTVEYSWVFTKWFIYLLIHLT